MDFFLFLSGKEKNKRKFSSCSSLFRGEIKGEVSISAAFSFASGGTNKEIISEISKEKKGKEGVASSHLTNKYILWTFYSLSCEIGTKDFF